MREDRGKLTSSNTASLRAHGRSQTSLHLYPSHPNPVSDDLIGSKNSQAKHSEGTSACVLKYRVDLLKGWLPTRMRSGRFYQGNRMHKRSHSECESLSTRQARNWKSSEFLLGTTNYNLWKSQRNHRTNKTERVSAQGLIVPCNCRQGTPQVGVI